MPNDTARAIEAILMVAQEPVDPHLLAQLLEVSPSVIEEACDALASSYVADARGFVLAKVAGGYRFQSHPDLAAYVERFALEGQSARLSNAALETLAIVAYKQPLSRAQVAAIRGVNVDGVMRTLQQRGYIVEVGRDTGPGQAVLFGTSDEFLERMGLDRIEDLPPIAALFPSAEVMEALEQTLRAAPSEPEAPPAAEPSVTEPGEESVAAFLAPDEDDYPDVAEPDPALDHTDSASDPVEATRAFLAEDEDDFPEPELPSWAVDPPPATSPDTDGDGQGDVVPEP